MYLNVTLRSGMTLIPALSVLGRRETMHVLLLAP